MVFQPKKTAYTAGTGALGGALLAGGSAIAAASDGLGIPIAGPMIGGGCTLLGAGGLAYGVGKCGEKAIDGYSQATTATTKEEAGEGVKQIGGAGGDVAVMATTTVGGFYAVKALGSLKAGTPNAAVTPETIAPETAPAASPTPATTPAPSDTTTIETPPASASEAAPNTGATADPTEFNQRFCDGLKGIKRPDANGEFTANSKCRFNKEERRAIAKETRPEDERAVLNIADIRNSDGSNTFKPEEVVTAAKALRHIKKNSVKELGEGSPASTIAGTREFNQNLCNELEGIKNSDGSDWSTAEERQAIASATNPKAKNAVLDIANAKNPDGSSKFTPKQVETTAESLEYLQEDAIEHLGRSFTTKPKAAGKTAVGDQPDWALLASLKELKNPGEESCRFNDSELQELAKIAMQETRGTIMEYADAKLPNGSYRFTPKQVTKVANALSCCNQYTADQMIFTRFPDGTGINPQTIVDTITGINTFEVQDRVIANLKTFVRANNKDFDGIDLLNPPLVERTWRNGFGLFS